jgi:hypothetical protein
VKPILVKLLHQGQKLQKLAIKMIGRFFWLATALIKA